jgi:nitrogen-specific signal transduction histidine kinase
VTLGVFLRLEGAAFAVGAVVVDHGGEITVASQPGATVVRVRLPVQTPP